MNLKHQAQQIMNNFRLITKSSSYIRLILITIFEYKTESVQGISCKCREKQESELASHFQLRNPNLWKGDET